MYEAHWLAEIATEIDKAVGRPFVCIDIGANVGLFSLFVASKAKRDATIIAIEPDRTGESQAHSLQASPRIPAFQFACYRSRRTITAGNLRLRHQ